MIRHSDGHLEIFNSKFEIQLVDFEVVDEYEDGIFEPGECVRVRNITVKNTGWCPPHSYASIVAFPSQRLIT